ncbi:hypothetical protein M6B38_254355 [Iris pallida]|uniref:Uncharacterized protein n=1 Tax=Iris pallida TaxID=29817 RepID=A0AAX6IHS8_IRIPA|nr:hypothetical protein M6B38_254355 [Iris pallida]
MFSNTFRYFCFCPSKIFFILSINCFVSFASHYLT